MNSWLQQMYTRLYTELDSLHAGHPSGRDNGRWIAETEGKLDACTLLKDTKIDSQRIDEVRKIFDGKPLSEVEEMYIEHYKNGATSFISDVIKRLNNG